MYTAMYTDLANATSFIDFQDRPMSSPLSGSTKPLQVADPARFAGRCSEADEPRQPFFAGSFNKGICRSAEAGSTDASPS